MAYHASPRSHASGRSSASAPTDIVTYRYDGEMVYVPVAPNYIQALSHAREAFPQLKPLHDTALSLSLTAPTPTHARTQPQSHQCVGISAPAWPKLIAHLARYQIIDVHSHDNPVMSIPHITITYADEEAMERMTPAPPYRASAGVEDEKAPCVQSRMQSQSQRQTSPRSRSPSPTPSMLNAGKRNWLQQVFHGQC